MIYFFKKWEKHKEFMFFISIFAHTKKQYVSMRRYLVLLLLSFVFLCVSAEEHMEYMGVSLGMSVDDFTAAMKEKG